MLLWQRPMRPTRAQQKMHPIDTNAPFFWSGPQINVKLLVLGLLLAWQKPCLATELQSPDAEASELWCNLQG